MSGRHHPAGRTVIALILLYLGVHWVSDVVGGVLPSGGAVLIGAAALETFTSTRARTVGGRAESATLTVAAVA